MVRVRAGTSGFSYPEWRGSFYPAELRPEQMLGHYAARLPAVEVNNTFYRMPKPAVLEGWGAVTPRDFGFALKASRRITHIGKLRNVADSVDYLAKVSAALGEKRKVVLFQLPPVLRRDDALLADFLSLLPAGFRAALEVRHESWFDDSVLSALRAHNVALVAGDPDEGGPSAPLEATADFGYLRLRGAEYAAAGIAAWHTRIRELPWQEVYVFFKHETLGPEYALALQALADGATSPASAPAKAAPRPGLSRGKEARPGLAQARAVAPKKRRRAPGGSR